MTLPAQNRGRLRWTLLRVLFPHGIEALIITGKLHEGDIGVVQFGKSGRYNTVTDVGAAQRERKVGS